MQCLMVGRLALTRKSSATIPSFRGTLKSTRMSTRFPFSSKSVMFFINLADRRTEKLLLSGSSYLYFFFNFGVANVTIPTQLQPFSRNRDPQALAVDPVVSTSSTNMTALGVF